jgi:HEAT repeat protein
MSITATCAKCRASYALADTMDGKTVRCKKCQSSFIVKAARTGVRTTKDAPPPLGDDEEEEEEDEAPPPPPKKKSSMGLVLGIIGGVLFLLFLLCGGTAFGIWYFVYSTTHAIKQGIEDIANNPPGPGEIPFPGGNNPKAQGINTAADAAAALKSGDKSKQDAAVTWLNKNAVDPARQKDVARALDTALDKTTDWTKGEIIKALATWGDKDSVPGMVKICNADKSPFVDDRTKLCWKAFAKIKDERGAEATVPFLHNFFAGGEAKQALIDMGQAAGEKAVLKALNHPEAHDGARAVLKAYGTKDDALIRQTELDFKDADGNRRRTALDYLNQFTVVPALKGEVQTALEPCLTDKEGDIQDRAYKGLQIWGGPESVPMLIKILDNGSPQDHLVWARSHAMDTLGKLKDPAGVPALVKRLSVPQDRGPASQALQAIGPAAEKELLAYTQNETNPADGRQEAGAILKRIGSTANVGLTMALTDLKGNDVGRRRDAAGFFARTPVDPAKQNDVRVALEACLEDQDVGTREQAAKALGVWGSPDSTLLLVKALDAAGQPDNVRHAIMEGLGKLKDDKAIPTLALHLTVQQDRDRAAAALEEMGSKSELEVGKIMLQTGDKEVAKKCCHILEKVGTKASVQSLNTLFANAAKFKLKDVQDAAKNAAAAASLR